MSASPNPFIWYDLMTTDAEAAVAFYSAVIGWTAEKTDLSDRGYFILSASETSMGGLMALPPSAFQGGARPGWLGYIGVDDVDEFAARIIAAGGAVHRPAEDLPGVGRFAMVADPQGAGFILFKPSETDMTRPPAGSTPGRVGWHELHAGERETAFAFYADMFGWTKGEAIDMGPVGIYQIFTTTEAQGGGIMTRIETTPSPVWVFYINVPGIDAAIERVKAAGGTVLNGPQEVPGGSWVAQGMDPQGAMFAMVAPGR